MKYQVSILSLLITFCLTSPSFAQYSIGSSAPIAFSEEPKTLHVNEIYDFFTDTNKVSIRIERELGDKGKTYQGTNQETKETVVIKRLNDKEREYNQVMYENVMEARNKVLKKGIYYQLVTGPNHAVSSLGFEKKYMIMPYVHGVTFGEYFHTSTQSVTKLPVRTYDLKENWEYMFAKIFEIAELLKAFYDFGVVHGDVHKDNFIMNGKRHKIYAIDFYQSMAPISDLQRLSQSYLELISLLDPEPGRLHVRYPEMMKNEELIPTYIFSDVDKVNDLVNDEIHHIIENIYDQKYIDQRRLIGQDADSIVAAHESLDRLMADLKRVQKILKVR